MGTWTLQWTCIYLFKMPLPSGHLICRAVTALAVVQREVNKRLLRGEALFFSLIHKEKS